MNCLPFNTKTINGLCTIDILRPITDFFWDAIVLCAKETLYIEPEVTTLVIEPQQPIIVPAEPRGS